MKQAQCGTVRESVFDNEYEYFAELIKGYEGEGDKIDETVLPVIYELDSVDEWQNEVAWYKANPRPRNYKKHKGH